MNLLAASSLAAALAAQPAGLAQPDGQWAVDYGARSCAAVRAFQHDDYGGMALRIEPGLFGGQNVRIVFADAPFPATVGTIAAVVASTDAPQSWNTRLAALDDGRQLLSLSYPSSKNLAVPGRIDITVPAMPSLSFAIPADALDAPIRTCLDDLWTELEIPSVRGQQVETHPEPVFGLFTPADYGSDGWAQTVYTVGTDGRIAHCFVWESSGSAPIDRKVCDILRKRYRSDPALDAEGNPVAVTYNVRIVFTTS